MNMPYPEPLAYSIADAMRVTSLGRTKLYAEISAKKIEVRRCGGRTLVLAKSLREYLELGEA